MKKITTLLVLTTAIITTSALAQDGVFSGPGAQGTTTPPQGGFVAPASSITTAANARTLADDTWVTLKGNIEQRTGDETYLFLDKSGSIKLDIDHKRWNGLTVSPHDTVEIQGKMDKGMNDVKVDVKQITKNS
ncbi:YgiW/YdeI family stress tolerance OB fold protein [Klebsiella aerogenes]|uniref:YgiW/YdeI family stress tolerance OB fold protein n=1 Tax=Klebsiella aerogenes TaxID=548 RepID=UPI0034D28431